MFRIAGDPVRGLVGIDISGFWTADDARAFGAKLMDTVAKLGTEPGAHVILCNVSDSAIQPQEVVEALQELVAGTPNPARRIALYTTKALPRMQARRIMAVRDGIAVFESREAAEAWLLA